MYLCHSLIPFCYWWAESVVWRLIGLCPWLAQWYQRIWYREELHTEVYHAANSSSRPPVSHRERVNNYNLVFKTEHLSGVVQKLACRVYLIQLFPRWVMKILSTYTSLLHRENNPMGRAPLLKVAIGSWWRYYEKLFSLHWESHPGPRPSIVCYLLSQLVWWGVISLTDTVIPGKRMAA